MSFLTVRVWDWDYFMNIVRQRACLNPPVGARVAAESDDQILLPELLTNETTEAVDPVQWALEAGLTSGYVAES